jgi:hypothetical protein
MTTWTMKLKSNGTWRSRLNACGYKQVDGSHYASDSIAAPVTHPITVQIILMLHCMQILMLKGHSFTDALRMGKSSTLKYQMDSMNGMKAT